jgi:hypothetical protein
MGVSELVILLFVLAVFVMPVVAVIICLFPPKTENKGMVLAIFAGPLAYLYVGRWGKAIGLYVLGWATAGVLHLIIWPYSIFNIRTEVRRYLEEQEIHQARLAQARAGLAKP